MLDMVYIPDYTEQILHDHGVFEKFKAEFYHMQLGLWYTMYCSIRAEYRDEAIREICKRYGARHKEAIKAERRTINWFYKGKVEGDLRLSLAYDFECFIKRQYRRLR